MQPVRVIPVKLGIANAYLVNQGGCVLIDTGPPVSGEAILAALHTAGLGRHDLSLVVITHGHGDHAGSAARIRELTGAPLAFHENDAEKLRNGASGRLDPTGLTGRIAGLVIGLLTRPGYPPCSPDIPITDRLDLAPFGVAGTVIPTPGHTAGSASVVLENGDVFAGDLIFPQIPSGMPGPPFWAENPADVDTSIRTLLASRPGTCYTGHGGPFPADAARQMITHTS